LKKSQKISLTLLAVFALIVIGFLVMQPKEPSYQGRRLTEWMADLKKGRVPSNNTQAEEAIRQMKTAALPFLEAGLSRSLNPMPRSQFSERYQNLMQKTYLRDRAVERERWERSFHALEILGPDAIPVLERLMDNSETATEAAELLGKLEAIEILEKGIAPDRDFRPRLGAVHGLSQVSQRKDQAGALLLALTQDPEPRIAGAAAWGLGTLVYKPEESVPRLRELLQSKNRSIRACAVYSLANFGPAAASAIPDLQKMNMTGDANLASEREKTIRSITPK